MQAVNLDSFFKARHTYETQAQIQKLMAQHLIKELVKIEKNFERVFEFGAGSGILTRLILEHITFKSYIANDLFDYENLRDLRIEWRFFDMNEVKKHNLPPCDLIISNAVLQWLPFHQTIENLKSFLCQNGILAFSSFGVENLREVRQITGAGLEYVNLQEIEKTLKRHFEILYLDTRTHTLRFPSAIAVFRHLKLSGVNAFKKIYLSKAMLNNYAKTFHNALTYQPLFVIARLRG